MIKRNILLIMIISALFFTGCSSEQNENFERKGQGLGIGNGSKLINENGNLSNNFDVELFKECGDTLKLCKEYCLENSESELCQKIFK